MKKIIAGLAAALMVLSLLCGCTDTNGSSAPADDTTEVPVSGSESGSSDEASGLLAGYGRIDVTPMESLPLRGFGNTTERMSKGYLDPIYASCIALTDENKETLLWFTLDFCAADKSVMPDAKNRISKATGVPEDHITITVTHTHSSVDLSVVSLVAVQNYNNELAGKMVTAAEEALADRIPASMEYGEVDLTGYNFVRHYITDVEGDPTVGDNHGDLHVGNVIAHVSEANHMMYMLCFRRENARDILLTNWRAHATLTGAGGNIRQQISADFIGTIRYYLEQDLEIFYAYMQGDAGNINPKTRLSDDVEKNPSPDYTVYGREIADKIEAVLKEGLTPIASGPIQIVNGSFIGNVNHETDGLRTIAQELYGYWKMTGNTREVVERGAEYGIDSPYEASAIVSRVSYGKTQTLETFSFRIGDFAFTGAPVEIFDTNGTYIRENAPTKYLFICGYTNSSNGYMPSQDAFSYGCYEADTSRYEPGTGELLANHMLESLNSLFP